MRNENTMSRGAVSEVGGLARNDGRVHDALHRGSGGGVGWRLGVACAAGLIATSVAAAEVRYDFFQVVSQDTPIPGGTGNFLQFAPPAISGGSLTFFGTGADGQNGIYVFDGELRLVADKNTLIPGGSGSFTGFGQSPSVDRGTVAFQGAGSSQNGIYTGTGIGGLTRLADQNTAIPGGTGNFQSFFSPWINGGNTAFLGRNASSQDGIYTNIGGLNRVADTSTPIPNGSGNFTSFGVPSLSDTNVAFRGLGPLSQDGIYARIDGQLRRIVDRSTPIPEGTGNFAFFDTAVVSGQKVAFSAWGLNFAQQGVYIDDNGLVRVADFNTPVPGGTGNFRDFLRVSIDDGSVVFRGEDALFRRGIYSTLGGTLHEVIAAGNPLDGGTVSGILVGTEALSDGSIALIAGLSGGGGGIYVALTEHRYTGAGGAFDAPKNWLFGGVPRGIVPTFIQPAHGMIITGPASATDLYALTIGATTSGVAELRLQPSGHLNVEQALTVQARGKLRVDGGATALGGITNAGEIELVNGGQITGGALNNQGLLRGDGVVGNALSNARGAEVRVESGKTLAFVGSSNTNSGEMRLLGGTAAFNNLLTNASGGVIAGRGTLIATGGLTNAGQMAFSAGFSDIFGDLENQSGGLVMVTGGGTATFYDEVVSVAGSEFRVSAGSTVVFLGDVTGTSAFTGAGTKIFEAGVANVEALATTGSTVVEASASLTADTIHEQGLSIGGQVTLRAGGGASEVQTLTIEGSGRLDLMDNSMLVKDGSVEAVSELVKSGWAGGSWDGPGINSSAAAGEAGRAVGVRPEGGGVLVKYTWGGDATLDGVVNVSDLSVLAGNWQQTGRLWSQGDFNFDGIVNVSDLSVLAGNWQKGASGGMGLEEALAMFDVFDGVVVPEPGAGLVGVLLGAIGMRRRGRTRG